MAADGDEELAPGTSSGNPATPAPSTPLPVSGPGPVSATIDPSTIDPAAPVTDADTWEPAEAKIRAVLNDYERVIPVIGAGVSQAAGLAGSLELAAHLTANFPRHPDVDEWSDENNPVLVAEDICNSDYEIEADVQKSVVGFWIAQLAATPPSELLGRLVTVRSRLIITFNYDDSLERECEEAKIPYERWDGVHDLRRFTKLLLDGKQPDKLIVLHLHGTVTDDRTVVLTSNGYAGLQNDEMIRFTQALLREWTMCFLGTKLDEPHITEGFLGAHKRGRPHPLFLIRKEAQLVRNRAVVSESRHGVKICELPTLAHIRGVIRFITSDYGTGQQPSPGHDPQPPTDPDPLDDDGPGLGPDVGPEPPTDDGPPTAPTDSAGQPPEPGSAAAEADYVPTVIVEMAADADPAMTDFAALMSVGRRRMFAPDFGHRFLTEDELAGEHRTVVVGVPGSGKSELLAYIGSHAAERVDPVLIRLHEVPFTPADAETRLTRWLAVGRHLNEAAEDGALLHLLLDGLDEVTPSEQARVADQILELATTFPQHRMTVTTRPVDAVAAFTGSGWTGFTLAPGSVWQKRYLERHHLKLNDLLDQLEAGRDLRDLLELPFFLTLVVRMRDRLAGLDLWGVVRKLVDEALELQGEKALLPVGVEIAREWFEDLALGLHLSGETLIRKADLDRMTIPSAPTSSPREVCEWLVSRMMFQPRNEGYAFTHRLIGEALAAAALDRREPTVELLDAIAPVVNSKVHGIRADWRVSTTFLMQRNAAWREAIRDRDEMQWARTVPDEPIEERREAAELLWSRYLDWRVWIWNYDLPDIIQDASALARHLRAGGLDDLVETIRKAFRDENARTRGNAIRVLSEARLPDLDLRDDLRDVLNTDGEEQSVVRRKAAIAASRLGYHDLLDLIVELAVDPEDETETQDGTYAAMDLARDDEVADVAFRLAQAPGGNYIALSLAKSRLAPNEFLIFLSRYAAIDEDDDDPLSSEKDYVHEAVDELTDPGPEVVNALASLSLRWAMSSAEIEAVLISDRAAALAGFAEVFANENWDWWRGRLPLAAFSADEIEGVGAPEQVVEMRRFQEERERMEREEPEKLAELIAAANPEPESQEEDKSLSLSQLLEKPRGEWDEIVAHHAQFYAQHIAELTSAEQNDLRGRLQEWWPAVPFPETITWTKRTAQGSSWTINNFAAAWLYFGPALDVDLDPDQWAEIAMSGVLFDNQTSWLQRKVSDEAIDAVIGICAKDDARTWRELLNSVPDPLPARLIKAVTERLRTFEADYELSEIVRRLTDARHLEALLALSRVSDEIADLIRPYLAQLGDDGALNRLLDDLAHDLEAGYRSDHDELNWLVGTTGNPAYLEKLFECLVLAHRGREARTPVRPRRGRRALASWGPMIDPMSPLIQAIRRIGGEDAVARYDQVLDTVDDTEFLRLQRDAIAEALLAEHGVEAGVQAAESGGLPYVPSD